MTLIEQMKADLLYFNCVSLASALALSGREGVTLNANNRARISEVLHFSAIPNDSCHPDDRKDLNEIIT